MSRKVTQVETELLSQHLGRLEEGEVHLWLQRDVMNLMYVHYA